MDIYLGAGILSFIGVLVTTGIMSVTVTGLVWIWSPPSLMVVFIPEGKARYEHLNLAYRKRRHDQSLDKSHGTYASTKTIVSHLNPQPPYCTVADDRVWSKYTFWDQIKKTQQNQIQICYFSWFQFKYNFPVQIQIHCNFLFKYISNALQFFVQIHVLSQS